MASLRKKPNSSFWYACFTNSAGRRVQCSTGISNRGDATTRAQLRKKALEIAAAYERVGNRQYAESRIRRTVARLTQIVTGQKVDDVPTEMVRRLAPEGIQFSGTNATSVPVLSRLSLSAQVADTLRRAIVEGSWKGFLPGERRLSVMLRVSRPTIRAALHQLAKEGVVAIRQGARNRLLSNQTRRAWRQSRLIGLVTVEPVAQLSLVAYQGISEMRAHLAEHGFTTEVLLCPPETAGTHRRKLEEFVRDDRVFCCVLASVSKEIQSWFAQRSLPALVLGSCHREVNLPSVDVDYRAVCRHAAGVFLRNRHRHIALLVADTGLAGDLASEQGFLEATTGHDTSDNIQAKIVRHAGNAESIGRSLDALFSSDRAPTALLVAGPEYVFIVIIYLLKRGLTVPDTVSLIARDCDHMFGRVNPPIAHYALDDTYANRVSRLMLQMVAQGFLPPEPTLIFPQYVAGGTVRTLR